MLNREPDGWPRLEGAVARLRNNGTVRRLVSGTAANLLGKVWVLGVQLATLPILAQNWGAEGYGTWLMLSTIPTYLALSDIGLGTAATVEITKRVAQGDYQSALQAFQSVWALVTSAVVLISTGIAVYSLFHYINTPSSSSSFDLANIYLAAPILAFYSIFLVQTNLLNTIFRATNKYALGTVIADALIPIEGIVLATVVIFGGGLVAVASGLALTRTIGCCIFHHTLKAKEPWVELGIRHASKRTATKLFHPSVAAFTLTLSNAIMLQGIVLTLGTSFGPGIVAVFASTRMLTRIPLQFAGLVTRASIPELTRLWAARNTKALMNILKLNIATALAVTIPPVIGLGLVGPSILGIMSKGEIASSSNLFWLLGAVAMINAAWVAVSSPLLATNQQWKFAYFYLLSAFTVVIIPYLFDTLHLLSYAATLLTAEVLTLLVVVIALRRSLRQFRLADA